MATTLLSLLVLLISGRTAAWAGCSLESIRLGQQKAASVEVIIRTNGTPDPASEPHPDKLVLYLRGCSAPSGSHSVPGDGVLVKQVRWNYKAEANAVWVVIEHRAGVTHSLEAKKNGQIRVVFSGDKSSKTGVDKPLFLGRQRNIPTAVRERLVRYSWNDKCPVNPDALALLTVTHWGFDEKTHQGELVVNGKVAGEMLDIFKELFERKFPIEKIRLIEEYQGSDDASMADNNSSAFNCRLAKGSQDTYSAHSYGLAIDINPLVNPYVKNNHVSPANGAEYLDRAAHVKGMIVKGGPCYNAFSKRGWEWGGDWKSLKDYQHFEKPR